MITNFLYILQAENYEVKRFLRFFYTHYRWLSIQERGQLVWTNKIKLLYAVNLFLAAVFLALPFILLGWRAVFFLPVYIFISPLFSVLALELIQPLDYFLKSRIMEQARIKLKASSITVIGITGSYGKTSTKEILAAILGEKFRVLKPEKNINTDIGVAEFIKAQDLSQYDVAIIEMGAYRPGEIKKICDIVAPDYAIITGINEAHLEKFRTLDNIIKTKFELAQAAKKAVILNGGDENIKKHYQSFSINNASLTDPTKITATVLPGFAGWEFTHDGSMFKTKLLARHNIDLIIAGWELARLMGVEVQAAIRGVSKINHIPHRLQPIKNERSGVLVIDDSYNGNFNGFLSGLEVLGWALGRKIVLTPGLVEQGNREEELHVRIGEAYAEAGIDLVLLVKNRVTDYMVRGMVNKNFIHYKVYNSTKEAHADLSNILKAGDTILFQNDWPDNYF